MGYFEMAVGLLFVLALQDLYQRHTSTRNTALMLGISSNCATSIATWNGLLPGNGAGLFFCQIGIKLLDFAS